MYIGNLKPTERFSNIAKEYSAYRPSYPENIIKVLNKDFGLKKSSIIADIGSGTGILSNLFLRNENIVYAVEPNNNMRKEAEIIFSGNPNFISINGTSECSKLKDSSVDFIIVGQAFHWFDKIKAKIEFKRILKKNGKVILIWNKRDNTKKIMKSYDLIIKKYCPDYKIVGYDLFKNEELEDFFHPNKIKLYTFKNYQYLNLKELIGRVRSTSYCIEESSRKYKYFILKLEELFKTHERDNKLKFEYNTIMYVSYL